MPVYTQHLFSGRDVDMFDLKPEDIDIHDIAHSLSMQCRFGGHTMFHYSVAQHCVYIANHLFESTGDPMLALCGLLHDASEAYLTDLPRPVKMQSVCEWYLAAERKAQRTIMTRFNLPMEDNELVQLADDEMLLMECRQLFNPSFEPDAVLTKIGHEPFWHVNIECITPIDAENRFFRTFVLLTGTPIFRGL